LIYLTLQKKSMGNYYELIALRLIHIFSGVFWAGAVIYLAAFIMPAVKAAGPEGGKFMQKLAQTNKLPLWMNLAAILTILAGFRLVQLDSNNFQMEWFKGNFGLTLTIGGTLAFIAFLIGFMVNRPVAVRMGKLGAEIAAAGGPPTAEQSAEMERLRKRMGGAITAVAWLLALCVVFMAVARYV
jgi:uncharacterized membrane protein